MPKQRRRLSKRQKRTNGFYFWGFATIVIIVALVQITTGISGSANALSGIDIPTSATINGEKWWNSEYSSRIALDTRNKNDTTQKFEFNHQQLVSDGSSLEDGDDLALIAQVDDIFDMVAFELLDPNKANTTVIFDISKYPRADYYLYFGDLEPSPSKVLGTFKLQPESAVAITGSEVQHPDFYIERQREWNLVKNGKLNIQVDYSSNVSSSENNSQLFYVLNNEAELIEIPDTNISASGDLDLEIDADTETGSNTLFLVIGTPDGLIRSNSIDFTVSAPVYVAITIDWEGRGGEEEWVLQEFSNLADKYNLQYTHFFNPRIFGSDQVPEYHANFITNWVKARHEVNGDEIALHLHMFYDMVEASGVTPIRSPRWGSGLDGYDVLTSGYSYQDVTKMLSWSLKKFEQAGLPRPKGFRAGGWFADMDVLRAVNDAGFDYDSSGREQYKFGNLETEGHWQLLHTTQPYFPSQSDQNKPGSQDRLSIIEIPNNGNDAYWHNDQQLIDRFYVNYSPGEMLSEPIMVTYLTHPDWYFTDKPRVERLLEEVDQYAWRNDSGPVVYTTIEATLEEWN